MEKISLLLMQNFNTTTPMSMIFQFLNKKIYYDNIITFILQYKLSFKISNYLQLIPRQLLSRIYHE